MRRQTFLPKGCIYVVAATFTPVWLLIWQSNAVKYPQLYAEKSVAEASRTAHVFNCVQRAHQNTLESLPIAVIGTLVTGLRFPILAASLMGTWTLARVLYTRGYATGDPDERTYPGGALTAVVQFALALAGTWTVGEFVWAELQ